MAIANAKSKLAVFIVHPFFIKVRFKFLHLQSGLFLDSLYNINLNVKNAIVVSKEVVFFVYLIYLEKNCKCRNEQVNRLDGFSYENRPAADIYFRQEIIVHNRGIDDLHEIPQQLSRTAECNEPADEQRRAKSAHRKRVIFILSPP
jgi:hypothetical protein